MRKRTLGKIFLAMMVLFSYTITTMAVTFVDVPTNHWAYKGIADMQQKGAMPITSKGEFFPNEKMNYFELCDALAKVTGYVDVKIATNVDANYKQQLNLNYQKQKPTLDNYGKKYSTWDKLCNQQVAYVMGKFGLTTTQLDRFMTKSNGKEIKQVVTKQDLAFYLVRLLGKEQTAKEQYKGTGFADESLIREENRPHVAYLKSIGLVKGNGSNKFGANTPVTKALCAKMTSDVLKYKDSSDKPQTTPITKPAISEEATVNQIRPKSETEYYVHLKKESNASWFTIKTITPVTDASGNKISITSINPETKVKVTTQLISGTDYITSMQVVGNIIAPSNYTVMTGQLDRIGTNGDISILQNDGVLKTYIVSNDCLIIIDGNKTSLNELILGSWLKVYIQQNTVVRIEITTSANNGNGNNNSNNGAQIANGELLSKTVKNTGYTLKVSQSGREKEIFVGKDVKIIRNGDTEDLEELKIGDKIEVINANGEIEEIRATGTRTKAEGTIKSILIAGVPQITIQTDKATKTYTLTHTTDIYDSNIREDIFIRDLKLGQKVEVVLDSKEVTSLIVQRGASGVNYKGTIQSIGKNNKYIDVLVDYDPLTDTSMVMKRIPTPIEVKILYKNMEEHRSVLDEGMDIVITYEYIEDYLPEKILVIE